LYQNTPHSSGDDVLSRLAKAGKAVEYFVTLAQRKSLYEAIARVAESYGSRDTDDRLPDKLVREDEFIEWMRAMTEREFTVRIAMPLIERLGYRDIRYSHSAEEYGKDLVFSYNDPLGNHVYCAAQIKRGRAGGNLGSKDVAALANQLIAAYTVPFSVPETMTTVQITQVWLITPCTVTTNARQTLAAVVKRTSDNSLVFLDGPFLFSKIREFAPELLNLCRADVAFSPSEAGVSEEDIAEFRNLFAKKWFILVQSSQSYPALLDRLVTAGLLEVTYGGPDKTFSLTPRGELFIHKGNKGGDRSA
jgi:hypothetical protein